MESEAKRSFGTSTAEERRSLVENAVPKATKVATSFWIGLVQTYYQSKKKTTDLNWKTISPADLAEIIEGFYVDVKKKDRSQYSRSSLLNARSAIQRHLSSCWQDINIFES